MCEGYTDVIGFFQAGLPRAVATCGTALADEHFRMLKNFARRVVLAYDADAAGQAAAERFYEWEQKFEVDIAVAALPPGADPADLARRDPDGLRDAVDEAQPFLAFRVERALAAADLRSPEGRARAAEAAHGDRSPSTPTSSCATSTSMQVADRCRVEPDRLRDDRQAQRAPRPPVGDGTSTRRARAADGPELEALQAGRAPARRGRRPAATRRCSTTSCTWPRVPRAGRRRDAARGHRAGPIPARPSCCSGWRSRRPTPSPTTWSPCSSSGPAGAPSASSTQTVARRSRQARASCRRVIGWLKRTRRATARAGDQRRGRRAVGSLARDTGGGGCE